jgi:formate hydrogenlyase subunit 3/multisubunit Na+/H+ antiporter MnhD subunit
LTLCLAAVAVLVATAIAALLGRGRAAPVIGAAGAVIAALLALPAAILVLADNTAVTLDVAWAAPVDQLRFGLDPLSAFFVIPLVALGAVCGIYGASYLEPARARAPACFFNLLVAAMLTVLLARDAVGLVIAWEVMTLASYLLVVHDHALPEVRRAGWIYLIASHLGLACILSAFLLLGDGHLAFADVHPETATAAAAVLALIGFGVKAGIVLYGNLRTIVLVGPALPWGPLLLGVGVVGALLAIALALYQRDLKRALAYSSVENMGVILIGVGVGVWAAQNGHASIATLGLCGALFHVWNHAVMKGLMFLGAGSVVHGAGTRDLEQMGGLAKRMPRTATLMILGSVALAALPPLSGFASEWLIYLGLVRGGTGGTASSGLILLFVVAVLATVGVLASLCFVRIIGIGLLGQPRSELASDARESGPGLVAPMTALAVLVVAMPLVMPLVAVGLEPVIAQLTGTGASTVVVGDALWPIVTLAAVLWAAFGIAAVLVHRLARRRRVDDTWGCGYLAPTPRMQYSGGSFAEGVHRLLPRFLRAKLAAPLDTELFPASRQVAADRQDPFTRAAYEPLLDRASRRFGQLRWVQQGLLHLYILYVVVAVVVAIAIVSVRDYGVLP